MDEDELEVSNKDNNSPAGPFVGFFIVVVDDNDVVGNDSIGWDDETFSLSETVVTVGIVLFVVIVAFVVIVGAGAAIVEVADNNVDNIEEEGWDVAVTLEL